MKNCIYFIAIKTLPTVEAHEQPFQGHKKANVLFKPAEQDHLLDLLSSAHLTGQADVLSQPTGVI